MKYYIFIRVLNYIKKLKLRKIEDLKNFALNFFLFTILRAKSDKNLDVPKKCQTIKSLIADQ